MMRTAPVPWTKEDGDIVFRLGRGQPWAKSRRAWSLLADILDSDRMLRRESFRQQCADLGAPQMPPYLWLIYFGV